MATVDDYHGDPAARVADFFKAWNFDLPPEHAAINERICDAIMQISMFTPVQISIFVRRAPGGHRPSNLPRRASA